MKKVMYVSMALSLGILASVPVGAACNTGVLNRPDCEQVFETLRRETEALRRKDHDSQVQMDRVLAQNQRLIEELDAKFRELGQPVEAADGKERQNEERG